MADAPGWLVAEYNIPDVLEEVREKINSFFEYLLTILDIALEFLSLIKAFAIGFLDPLLYLLEQIIKEIEAFLHDLKQVGLYITGDWNLLEWPLTPLKGGFSEYERRMLGRLMDRSDPTRPDFSARSKCWALFLYCSDNGLAGQIIQLIKMIKSIYQFFSGAFSNAKMLAPAVNPSVSYGWDGANFLSNPKNLFNAVKDSATSGSVPNIANISWKMGDPANKSPWNPFPPLPADGWMIEVSTVPKGIHIYWSRPLGQGKGEKAGRASQKRETGPVMLSNFEPLVLWGGWDQIKTHYKDEFGWNKTYGNKAEWTPGSMCYYGLINGEGPPLDLGQLKGDKPILQHNYFKGEAGSWFSPGEGYTDSWVLDEMPLHAEHKHEGAKSVLTAEDEPVGTFYVRITQISDDIQNHMNKSFGNFGTEGIHYKLTKEALLDTTSTGRASGGPVTNNAGSLCIVDVLNRNGDKLGSDDLSLPTQPMQISYPNAYTQTALDAITSALMLAYLTRADIGDLEEISKVGNTASAEEISALIASKEKMWSTASSEGYAVNMPAEPFTKLGNKLHAGYVGQQILRLFHRYTFKGKGIPSTDNDPEDWCFWVRQIAEDLAKNLYEKMGPSLALEKFLTESSENLRGPIDKWGKVELSSPIGFKSDASNDEYTLIGVMDSDKGGDYGVARSVNDIFTNTTYAPSRISTTLTNLPVRYIAPDGKEWRFLQPSTFYYEYIQQSFKLERINNDPNGNATKVTATGQVPASQSALQAFQAGLPDDWHKQVLKDTTGATTVKSDRIVTSTGDFLKSSIPVFYENREILALMDGDVARFAGQTSLHDRQPKVWRFADIVPDNVFAEASLVLKVCGSTRNADGEWIALRIPMLIPGIEDLFDEIVKWLRALVAMVQSIIDQILAYIEMLEARIYELQALLRKIQAMLNKMFLFELPQCAALFVTGDGTDGITMNFLQAENKPDDGPGAYGAGVCVMTGLPLGFLFDLLGDDGGEDGSLTTQPVVPITALPFEPQPIIAPPPPATPETEEGASEGEESEA